MNAFRIPVESAMARCALAVPSKQNTAAASAGTARSSGYSVLSVFCRGFSSR
jgi:hypothetical protein